ncbi:23S rRNA (uracil(747)-C(5))-methyltransferase RlmC [Nocardioides marmorisolisilvae]|uniref:23S rRNA (Uracil(747)-C(5))-methyltransferase RlmC n=1 Tax=Nocardioides marmorisolisilvae TaxID=1542737 RepID=A0A3N0DUJ1_9ACTN|nr:23S rRNA (uracil(747)-C(5))-methyltransferase RlmC [Nocardioides marmorisolisilvae]RNL79295.1 23S rRNA (uracil(747)-C(5))-methyltransferase RlmC [Nocardioides marmorisolisilvae]
MDCRHYDAGRCRSCTWLPIPYADQLAAAERDCRELLGEDLDWRAPFASVEEGFRNKAKMVVTGSIEEPRLGILGEGATGVDLRDCGLHEPAIQAALPVLAGFVTRAALAPYDVAQRRGELKFVLVTAAPSGDLMVRFVSRSQEPVTRIRKHLPWLLDALPGLRVVTVNVQPEHKAVLEGELEIVLTEHAALALEVNGHTLLLRPQSFFQTNTAVAAGLYREAAAWVDALGPASLWDLYCGVGGFALHLAAPHRTAIGVETSVEAIASARETARRSGAAAEFVVGDATAFATSAQELPDLVVVNPPRRGIGTELARWLQESGIRHVLYSSCNPASLASDLEAMPGLRVVRARLFDMFPQTAHSELLVLLERHGDAVGSRP